MKTRIILPAALAVGLVYLAAAPRVSSDCVFTRSAVDRSTNAATRPVFAPEIA